LIQKGIDFRSGLLYLCGIPGNGVFEREAIVAFDFNRTYGIELEFISTDGRGRPALAAALNRAGLRHQAVVENWGEHDTTKWGVTTDNSIQGGRLGEGIEIRGPILSGQEGLDEIEKVCRVLEQQEVTVHRSCGFHIHIDVRRPTPLSINSLRRLAMFYAETEALLDMAQPPSRRLNGNTYAKSVANIDVAALARCQDASAIGRVLVAASHAHASKFHKINFDPVAYVQKGTVEFRHHAGTTNFEKIKNWIMLAHRYVRMAEDEAVYPISAAQVQHVQNVGHAVRAGTKAAQVYAMLTRPEGATMPEITAATGWKTMTFPGFARDYGLVLRTEDVREGQLLQYSSYRRKKITRYFATPITPAQVAAVANIKPKPESWEQLAERLGMTDEEKRFWMARVETLAAPIARTMTPALDSLVGIGAGGGSTSTPF
jgi:hypothetical protein